MACRRDIVKVGDASSVIDRCSIGTGLRDEIGAAAQDAGNRCAAAIGGNTVNYSIGRLFGDKLAARFPRIVKKEYLDKTHAFYEKYGGETIIITRFVPIVRTFAPFVAGVGHMTYLRFSSYNVLGGVLWVGSTWPWPGSRSGA